MHYDIVYIEETDSTNCWLRQNGDGAEEGCRVVVADYQTAGKGCGSNSWESQRAMNLTFSLLIHPHEIPASRQWLISEQVSVALCETLASYIGQVEIKWPNDIYAGDRKLCGILIENRLQGSIIKDSIIGIGLNVNQKAFFSDAPNPVSLCQILGHDVDRKELLDGFLDSFDKTVRMEWNAVSAAYRSRLYRRNGFFDYKDDQGLFKAKLLNVLEDGRLVLMDTEGAARIYAFKEVGFVV